MALMPLTFQKLMMSESRPSVFQVLMPLFAFCCIMSNRWNYIKRRDEESVKRIMSLDVRTVCNWDLGGVESSD